MFQAQNLGGPLDDLLNRPRPHYLQPLFASPLQTLAKTLYRMRRLPPQQSPSQTRPLTIVCTSDTHNSQPRIPLGDLLIHAGDLTQSGTAQELQTSLDWLNSLPHTHKLVIAGNHDMLLDPAVNTASTERDQLNWGSLIYLEDSVTVLRFHGGRTLKVYGSPRTRKHGSWAFQYPRGENRWSGRVPEDTDVLVTHCPPRFHLDCDGFGDEYLLEEVWRVRPKVHVFGHVHEGYGEDFILFDSVDSLYERVLRGESGVVGLLKMAFWVLYTRLVSPGWTQQTTLLINPSAVGGLRDRFKRKALLAII